jgi:cytochrome c-type biogenesis protein CcmH
MKKKALVLISFSSIILGLLIIPASSVSAQKPTPSDDQVNAIARQLYCPVCENTPLDVCPTTACHQWRELIRRMLAEGKSEAEIKQYFVDYYGASVLSEPPASGINWLIYIVPPVVFLIGVFLLLQAFRTWKKAARDRMTRSASLSMHGTSSVSGSASDDLYISRLEEELKKRK